MTESQKDIYINIRAEQIKHFQDTKNGHLFNTPYSIETSKQIAKTQLENDLERGSLRITLDELLLWNNEDCIDTVKENTILIAKEIYKNEITKY